MASTSTESNHARVVIITGAAQGIGKAIALRLADDGLDIVVNDIPAKAKELDALVEEIKSRQRRSIAVLGDVTQEADVDNLVKTTVDKLGSLDVMIANAGIGRNSPLVSTSIEEFDLVQNINVRGVFLCYKAAAVQMIKQGRGGRIIGAGSMAGKKGAPNWGPYCASKFAVRGLTQSAAAELWQHGITVNAYAPGAIDTTMWNDIDDTREKHGLPRIHEAIFTHGRPDLPVGTPNDVAGLVSYLVRPDTKFVTGQSMSVNGGSWYD